MVKYLLQVLVGCAVSLGCQAKPAVVYDEPKFDESFNVAAFEGIERFKKTIGPADQAFGRPAIERFAKAGADPVIAIGYGLSAEVERVARAYPHVHFTVIDSVVDLPNVESIVFKDNEGAFLVGMLAALSSKTGKLGFVGGMDLPVIHGFRCGYEHGALFVDSRTKVIATMTGTTPAAFNDPARGKQLANELFAQDVDVVFAAAGGTGLGVYEAAAAKKKLAIGVDRNQNSLYPGTMLTSMLKRIDVAVLVAARSGHERSWQGGRIRQLGLRDGALGWALDRHNRALVSPEVQKRIEAAQEDISSGRVKVAEYAQGFCRR